MLLLLVELNCCAEGQPLAINSLIFLLVEQIVLTELSNFVSNFQAKVRKLAADRRIAHPPYLHSTARLKSAQIVGLFSTFMAVLTTTTRHVPVITDQCVSCMAKIKINHKKKKNNYSAC